MRRGPCRRGRKQRKMKRNFHKEHSFVRFDCRKASSRDSILWDVSASSYNTELLCFLLKSFMADHCFNEGPSSARQDVDPPTRILPKRLVIFSKPL